MESTFLILRKYRKTAGVLIIIIKPFISNRPRLSYRKLKDILNKKNPLSPKSISKQKTNIPINENIFVLVVLIYVARVAVLDVYSTVT